MEKISIQNAKPEDTPVILGFIKELASYEKLENEVVATEDLLNESLFGEKPFAEVILAEIKGKTVGYALFFFNFSTFLGRPGLYIEDLYVKPEFRSRGIGKELLKHCATLAKERNCGRMEWWVLEWNPARKFYENLGAKAMDELIVYRLTGKPLEKLAIRNF
ncbi:MAG: GNAT family N-acetyltransferase [Bacteroidales bacterium]|nr:GNAT family N-acetyltransferase [Bacteroidales bacterium]